jgi:malonyl-CoA decarboxylase
LKESYGLMVNYRYLLEDIETNHEVFAEHGTIVASDAVRGLLARPRESSSLAERAKFSIFGGAQRS